MADHANTLNLVLLCTELPSASVAADLLIRAQIDEPVKMVTAPDPDRSRVLVRAGWAKAATLARSTSDAPLLDRLAGHGSVKVKHEVLANPATADETRRRLEGTLAVQHTQAAQTLVTHASTSYLRDLLTDPARVNALGAHRHLAARVAADDHRQELATLALSLGIPALRAHLADQVALVGLGGFDLTALIAADPHPAPSTNPSSPGPAFDTMVAARIREVDTSALAWLVDRGTPMSEVFTVFTDAQRFTEDAGLALLDAVDVDTARNVLARTPGTARFEVFSLRFGQDELARSPIWRSPDTEAATWAADAILASRPVPVTYPLPRGVVQLLLEHPDALYRLALDGDASSRRLWFSGACPDHVVDPEQAAALARSHPSAMLGEISGLRGDTDHPHVRAVVEVLLDATELSIAAGALEVLARFGDHQELAAALRPWSTRPVTQAVQTLSQGHALQTLSTATLDDAALLGWLRLSGSVALTAQTLTGRFTSQLSQTAVRSLLDDPGKAFLTRPGQHGPAEVANLVRALLADLAYQEAVLTPGAETVLKAQLPRVLNERLHGRAHELVAAMIAGGIAQVAQGRDAVFMTALEMVSRSDLPLDRVLASAARLS